MYIYIYIYIYIYVYIYIYIMYILCICIYILYMYSPNTTCPSGHSSHDHNSFMAPGSLGYAHALILVYNKLQGCAQVHQLP